MLAGYNAGENAVINSGYRVPPYRETQSYVTRGVSVFRRITQSNILSLEPGLQVQTPQVKQTVSSNQSVCTTVSTCFLGNAIHPLYLLSPVSQVLRAPSQTRHREDEQDSVQSSTGSATGRHLRVHFLDPLGLHFSTQRSISVPRLKALGVNSLRSLRPAPHLALAKMPSSRTRSAGLASRLLSSFTHSRRTLLRSLAR